MKLSRQTKALLPQLEEACRTSRDDMGIAKYYHIPAFEVQAVRLMIDEREIPPPRKSAEEIASAELLARTRKLFWKWEVRHGFRKGAGMLLVPAGYMPEDRP